MSGIAIIIMLCLLEKTIIIIIINIILIINTIIFIIITIWRLANKAAVRRVRATLHDS